jgi:hypothetical protein
MVHEWAAVLLSDLAERLPVPVPRVEGMGVSDQAS